MTTIDSVRIVSEILKNEGKYPGDPPVAAVYEYKNVFTGKPTCKVCYNRGDIVNFILGGICCGEPVLLFAKGGLTEAGLQWLKRNQ